MSAIRPYNWSQLKRLSSREVALMQSVSAHLSPQAATRAFRHQASQILSELLHAPCQISAPEIRTSSHQDVAGLLPELGVFAILGGAPGPTKWVVDIDSVIASHVVESLLGGGGADAAPPIRTAREPTELELGVISFALLRLIDAAQTGLFSAGTLALMLDAIVGRSSALDTALSGSETFVQLGFRLVIGRAKGYCRILLPESFVDQHFGKSIEDSHAPEALLPQMRRRIQALAQQDLTLVVEGARLSLSPEDISGLEEGDIIVLDEHQLAISPEGPSGSVTLRPNGNRHGHLAASMACANNAVEVTINTIVEQQSSQGATMAEEPEDNLPATEGLLREMDASVAVELGRIRLNTAQVIRLREGQVLKLARGANDPVDLVIRGKVFGRGELVEVDGEMGVRLTQITGEN